MISTEVLRRIRQNQDVLRRTSARLRHRCARARDADLERDIISLDRALRDHMGLVDAVLDAVTEDDVAPVP